MAAKAQCLSIGRSSERLDSVGVTLHRSMGCLDSVCEQAGH